MDSLLFYICNLPDQKNASKISPKVDLLIKKNEERKKEMTSRIMTEAVLVESFRLWYYKEGITFQNVSFSINNCHSKE